MYSLVNKNKQQGFGRNRKDRDRTLSPILDIKLARPESTCTWYNVNPSQKLLESAKKATTADNEEQSNKQSSSNAEV